MVVYQTDETRCDYSSVRINDTENMSYEKKTTGSLPVYRYIALLNRFLFLIYHVTCIAFWVPSAKALAGRIQITGLNSH